MKFFLFYAYLTTEENQLGQISELIGKKKIKMR